MMSRTFGMRTWGQVIIIIIIMFSSTTRSADYYADPTPGPSGVQSRYSLHELIKQLIIIDCSCSIHQFNLFF